MEKLAQTGSSIHDLLRRRSGPTAFSDRFVETEQLDRECTEPENFLIAIVDDDESIREAVTSLLKSVGFRAEAFTSAHEFSNSDERHRTACLILDVRMPGMSGLELQSQLAAANCRIPIIFISAHDHEEAQARAFEAGAIDFLHKPFSEEALLNGVRSALGHFSGRGKEEQR
jgi:FixJ family two-component response regulator